ncbi:hypothetical protein RHGRI_012939 [Rhododendron griersonianum]|uniref:Agglutinin domain-containing protein n=1 Tax=Rhododendron griersonianum TaxID=479676 RepID=A0AAV6K3V3_9ERIC|nr:hypothetical protein RHGRI_012939 [Rhododendron griersonianum]KAG5547075.1 hypothetical protein RHGRI_012939 [Rhododendron griersonianum]
MREDGGSHGTLQFSGEEILSPYSKFEIERAKNDNGFVDIRCCYNNKYWVAKSSSDPCIIAGADEPNENQSQWSCTLFEPIQQGECFQFDGEGRSVGPTSFKPTVRFRHVQLGRYLTSATIPGLPSAPYNACLSAQSTSTRGQRPSARWIEGHQYLQFASSDNGDLTVGNEVFITKNGIVRIKNNHFRKFWRRNPNWIWADSDDTTTGNLDTLFFPVKVGDDVITLRNLGNNNFCKRLTTEGKTSCLNAVVTTISRETRLVVEELVFSRKIDNVKFRLLDARIYNQNIITMAWLRSR